MLDRKLYCCCVTDVKGPKSLVEQTTFPPQPPVESPPLVVVVVVVEPPPEVFVEPEPSVLVDVVLPSQSLLAHVLVPLAQSSLPEEPVVLVVVPDPEDPSDVLVAPSVVDVVVDVAVLLGSIAIVQPSVDEVFPRHRIEISTP